LTILVIVGTRTDEHSLRSQVGIGSESHCFFGQLDSIKTWTGLSVEESIRMTEDRDKWRKYVHGVANPRIEDD